MTDQEFSKNTRAVLITSALCLLSGAALAASMGTLKDSDFKALDINRDGYVDAKEAQGTPQFADLLKSADKDSDGRLSEAEFRASTSTTEVPQR